MIKNKVSTRVIFLSAYAFLKIVAPFSKTLPKSVENLNKILKEKYECLGLLMVITALCSVDKTHSVAAKKCDAFVNCIKKWLYQFETFHSIALTSLHNFIFILCPPLLFRPFGITLTVRA